MAQKKETRLQQKILKTLSRGSTRLFRNNVGLFTTVDGRKVMTGLCKGSSDLIGWTIRDGVAVFVAIEIKTEKGRVSKEQQNFIDAVNESGGIAGVVKSLDDCKKLLYGVKDD